MLIKKQFDPLEYFRMVFLPTIIFFIIGTFYIIDPTSIVFALECTSNDPNDKDGDGIPNNIETNGMDINSDGNIDLNLSALEKKPSPDHKDLFLEIDYMEYHIPIDTVIPNVINAFEKAPTCNPDNRLGITLHVQLGEEISPHLDSINLTEKNNRTGDNIRTWHEFNELKDKYFGTNQERNDPNHENIINAKKLIYHYAIFAHFFDYQNNSGISNSKTKQGGMDFIVSLGDFTLNSDIDPPHRTGNVDEQEGTLMHEFGHNLGLGHGGIDDINCKPNYISVMNYVRQFASIFNINRDLNYSPIALESLDESKLNESKGVEPLINSSIIYTNKAHNPPNVPIDWNLKNGATETNLKHNINYIEKVGKTCKLHNYDILLGNNDWENLIYLTSNLNNTLIIDNLGLSIDNNEGFSISENRNSLSDSNASLSRHDSLSNEELSYDVIQNINIDRLSSLNDKIEKISENTTTINPDAISEYLGFTNITDTESALDDGTSLESPKTVDYLESGSIDSAISSLDYLTSRIDESAETAMSEENNMDNYDELKKVSDLIKNTTELFKSQSCKYNDCSVVEKDPNTSLNY